ncbi:MAG: GntR family transcriptional regulator, partial [Candidatus Thermoplasmatota archaeon]|nr:GntR family transcriptional regulator [Candidatus Thermoplasmatota archaeon]
MRYVSGWVLTENGLKEGSIGFEDGLIQEFTGQKVKDAIARGTLKAGEKLPSIREMSRELSISPI